MATQDKNKDKDVKTEEEVKAPVEGTYAALLEKAKTENRVEVMTPRFLEFKVGGQKILGRYKGRTEVGGGANKRAYYQYIFETDDGPVKFHLGNVTDGEAGALMVEGDVYLIEYQGQADIPGGKRVNRFNICHILDEGGATVGGPNDKPF